MLSETRRIIIFFRKSALRNGIIQKYFKLQENEYLCLLLDCKTRWNSLVPIFFLKISYCINETLHEIGANKIKENIVILKEILLIIEPVKLAVNELSKSDSNLFTYSKGQLA